MNALNRSTVEVSRPFPPLVVRCAPGCWAWIEHGVGHILHARVGQWTPLTDAPGLGGSVLDAAEVAELVATFGRPTPS